MKNKLCLSPSSFAPSLCVCRDEFDGCFGHYHYTFKHLEEDLNIKLSRNLKKMIFKWVKKFGSYYIFPEDYDTMNPDTDFEPKTNKPLLRDFVCQGYKIANVLKSELPDFEIYYSDIILKDDVLIEGE